MKARNENLLGRLQELSPAAATVSGMLYLAVVGIGEFYLPPGMRFTLLYLLGVAFIGWCAGLRLALAGAVLACGFSIASEFATHHPHYSFSIAVWNDSTRFLLFAFTGWVVANAGDFARRLSGLVEERTADLRAEVEQHKATASALADTIERFEQVVNNITEVFWLSELPDHRVVYASPGYEHVWGRQREEVYREPLSWLAALHPNDREQIGRRFPSEQPQGGWDVEYRIIRPDGAVRWIRDRAFPVRNKQGQVYRIAGLAEDITERKQTREVLQTQAAILENMAEAVVVMDEAGLVVQMNPAAEQMWRIKRDSVLGKPATAFSALPEAESAAIMRGVLTALETDGSWRGTFHDRRKDGSSIICDTVVSPLQLPGRRLIVAVEQDVTERERVQEQLQMQARVLESMGEAVLMTDEQGTIVLTNPALDALVGYEAGELKGKPMHLLAGTSLERHNQIFNTTVKQIHAHGSAVGHYLARRKDGSLVEVETRSSGMSVGGRFGLIVVGQDVTERKRVEQALRQSEETLRVFLNAIPTPALLLDRNGTILTHNQALLRSLGQPASEVAGKQLCDLLPPEIAKSRQAIIDEVVRSRKPLQSEDTRAGRYFVNFASPILDPAGNVMEVAVLALDITERKRAEAVLAKQEALYRTLFELSPDGILLEDINGKILDANRALCQAFGYSHEELVGRNVRCLVPPESQGEVAAHLAILRAGQELKHEVVNLRKSAERCTMWLNEKPLLLPDGRQGILVVARDITESKRGELIKQVFLSLGRKLGSVRTPVEAARAIYASADQLWKWDSATLSLYSRESDLMDCVLFCDVIDGQRLEVPANPPVCSPTARMRQVMEQGAQLTLRGEADMHAADSIRFGDVSRLSASIMSVPMRRHDQPVGVLSIQSYRPNAYTQEDLRTLQALADYCAGALERIRAEAAVLEAHDKLELRVQVRTAQLQESEQKYRRLHESLTDALVTVEMDGRITEFNPAYQALLGYSAEELRNLTHVDLTPEKWHALDERILAEQVLPRGHSEVFEKEYRRKDGTIFPIELRTFLIRDAHGRPAAMWAIVRDITRRKQVEAALRQAHDTLEARVRERTAELETANAALAQSEERYRSLVTNLNVGVYRNTPDPHGRLLQVNPALARIFGYDSLEGFQALKVSDTYQDPEDRKVLLAELLRQGAVSNFELRLKKKDGTPIYGSVNATVHRGPDGEVDWIDGVLEDITQRKRGEEALRASEERYRTLAESSPDAIFILDRDVRVAYVNSTAAALWRRKPEELIGLAQADLFPGETGQEQSRVVAGVFETGIPVHRDKPLAFPVGEQWIEIRLAPMYDAKGTVTSVMGIARLITERKRAEQQLAEALDLNQKMIAASTMGIAAYKATGEGVFANEALARMVGGKQSEVLQDNFRQLAFWRDCGLLQLAEEALSQRQARSGEIIGTTRFGKAISLDCHLTPFISNGQPHLLLMALDITERKRSEVALKMQSLVLQNMAEGTLLTAPDQTILFANSALETMFGYEPGQLMGQHVNVLNTWTPEESARFNRTVVLATEGGRIWHGQYENRRKDGTEFTTEARVIRLALGGHDHFISVQQDITERKRAESLLQAQRDLAITFSLTSDLKAGLKRLLEITMQMGGVDTGAVYLLDEATGGMNLEVHHGASPAFVQAESYWAPNGLHMRLISQGRPIFGRFQDLPLPRDKVRQAEGLRGTALVPLAHNGKVIGALAVASRESDVIPHQTQLVIEAIAAQAAGAISRIRAETALRESETRLRAIITGAPVLLFAVDQDAIIRFEDGKGLEALGSTRGTNLGRSVMEVYAHFPAIIENARRALGGEEFEAIFEAGSIVFDCWYSPTRDKDGKSTGYIGVATNISERHHLERQLLEISDREHARIGQDLHDGLCQQLVSLGFDANSLQGELAAARRPEAKTARRIADYLDRAITETRRLSRGLFPVRMEKDGLPSALEELARATRERFGIPCRFDSKGPAQIENSSVATHLYRIAQEAVTNAVKHSRATKLSISLRAEADQLELRVEDDGTGLSPATRNEATGLGLHIMDYRARTIGGTLHISPRRRGGTQVSCCVWRARQ